MCPDERGRARAHERSPDLPGTGQISTCALTYNPFTMSCGVHLTGTGKISTCALDMLEEAGRYHHHRPILEHFQSNLPEIQNASLPLPVPALPAHSQHLHRVSAGGTRPGEHTWPLPYNPCLAGRLSRLRLLPRASAVCLYHQPERPRFIFTIPGVGYRFTDEVEPGEENANIGIMRTS